MTIVDTENKLLDTSQEYTLQQIATDKMQTTTGLYYSETININDLARTVYEMKKKIDVLSEHFAFLFTQFDKSEQN